MSNNIHPVFDKILSKEAKEDLLNQHSKVLWLTGLSGSGKTTLAIQIEQRLHRMGYLVKLLDGDNIRYGLNKNLGFSEEDRTENIRRIAEVCKLFANCGVITIACFVSPTNNIRAKAKKIIGQDFIEVFVDTPLEICEKRDVKGLYKKARAGEIKNFTGISAPFEKPRTPDIQLDTTDSIENTTEKLLEQIIPLIKR